MEKLSIKTKSRLNFSLLLTLYYLSWSMLILLFLWMFILPGFIIQGIFWAGFIFLKLWPKCVNCGLPYLRQKISFIDKSSGFKNRTFPTRYCECCGQDHWYPYDPPNNDWKTKEFDVYKVIQANKAATEERNKANKAARKLKKANKK